MLFNKVKYQANSSRVRILFFLIPLFFFYINENIISLTYPIIGEHILQDAMLMGLIISLTSLVAIICDFVFPQILKASNWKQQFVIGMILAILLNATLTSSFRNNDVILLILAGILWSVYYEFCAFSLNNYLAVSEKNNNFVYDWSLITIIYNIASILGPIIASFIIDDFFLILLLFQILALLAVTFVGILNPNHETHLAKSKFKQTFSFLKELHIWKILIPKILPLLLFSISLGILDSVYWTIGGLYAEELFNTDELAFVPIVMYSLPFVFGAMVMAKLNVKKYKKLISQIFLGITTLILLLFFIPNLNPVGAMAIILISSLFMALAEPLNDAAYSDLLSRIGKNMEHLIGIKKVSYSIAYLIGPLMAGYLSEQFGFASAIGITSLFVLIIVVVLLVITPKKIRLPQEELDQITK